jgi:rRNA maturation RNase YbeY
VSVIHKDTASGINFFSETSHRVGHQRVLKNWIEEAIAHHDRVVNWLTIVMVDDKHITKLNKTHLGHAYATDVITFQYNKKGHPLEAEIYIGTEIVRKNAKRFKVSFQIEMYRVIIHGILHLMGFSDKSAAGRKIMRAEEDRLLRRLSRKLRAH